MDNYGTVQYQISGTGCRYCERQQPRLLAGLGCGQCNLWCDINIHPNGHFYGFSYQYTNQYSYSHKYPNGYANTNCHADFNSNANCYSPQSNFALCQMGCNRGQQRYILDECLY